MTREDLQLATTLQQVIDRLHMGDDTEAMELLLRDACAKLDARIGH